VRKTSFWPVAVCNYSCDGILLFGRGAGANFQSVCQTQYAAGHGVEGLFLDVPIAKESHPYRLHDIITVVVNENSVVNSQGQMDRKKQGYGDLKLPNWILLKGFSVVPDPATAGVPHVRGEVDNKLQTHANLQTSDSIKFHVACSIVDIRPNGNMVLEGHRTIKSDKEVWDFSVSGRNSRVGRQTRQYRA